jgi:hypothetical protein
MTKKHIYMQFLDTENTDKKNYPEGAAMGAV